jgi:hypothetical protein
MGMGFRISGCSCKRLSGVTNVTITNPNPANFSILKFEMVGEFLILFVRYPDCTNFEGRKILVFEDISADDLFDQKRLDPHFCEECFSPIARFVPTQHGWDLAMKFCQKCCNHD